MKTEAENIHEHTVEGFGRQWSAYNQSQLSEQELEEVFKAYFCVFPHEVLNASSVGIDFGCGSGRWAKKVVPRVRTLHCVDASAGALEVAKKNLSECPNVEFHLSSIDRMPIADNMADFGYSLGVLHHMPDTGAAIQSCVTKLKNGAPLLLFLHSACDNKPLWYKMAWQFTDFGRRMMSRLPFPLRNAFAQVIALLFYFPLARISRLLERGGFNVDNVPLSFYRNSSFYVMRTDALDRFGTRLTRTFSRQQILKMMTVSGLEKITFSEKPPYWCAVGYKK